MNDTPKKEKSFFLTLPGILTGLAALITAVGTLIVALRTQPQPVNPAVVQQNRPSPGPPPQAELPPAKSAASASPRPRIDALVFQDDFQTTQNWTEFPSGPGCHTWYENGEYVLRDEHPTNTCWVSFSDKVGYLSAYVRIELSLRQIRGPGYGYGIQFGGSDESFHTAYIFLVNALGYYWIDRWDGKQWNHMVAMKDPSVRTMFGETNRLALEITGKTIRYYVNEKFLGMVEADQEVRGYIGPFLAQPGLEVAIDDLKVARLTLE